jgi:hypothetical protein
MVKKYLSCRASRKNAWQLHKFAMCYKWNARQHVFLKEEVHYWPSNYSRSLVLTINLENQESLATQLLKTVHIWPWGGFAEWFWWHGWHVATGPHVRTPLSSSSLSSLTLHSSQTLARRHRLPPPPLLPASHTWSLLEPAHHSAPPHMLNLPRREDPTTPHRRRWGRRHRHLHGCRHPHRGHTPASTTTCASS